MIVLTKPGQAGTMESSDIMVTIAPAEAGGGIELELTSPVIKQYGKQIKNVLLTTLQELGVQEARVFANDKGALDCTIRARVKTALFRALAEEA